MQRLILLLALSLSMLLQINQASATLIGDQVLIAQNRTASGTIRDDLVTVVQGALELSCPNAAFELCSANIPGLTHGSFDIEAASITLNVGSAAGPSTFDNDIFNGYIFSDLNIGGPGITGITLLTDIKGLDSSRVNFGADFVGVNLQGLTVNAGEFFTVDVAGGQAPEPGTLALFGLGALGLLGTRRRRELAARNALSS